MHHLDSRANFCRYRLTDLFQTVLEVLDGGVGV